jgi:hypothetical protein
MLAGATFREPAHGESGDVWLPAARRRCDCHVVNLITQVSAEKVKSDVASADDLLFFAQKMQELNRHL